MLHFDDVTLSCIKEKGPRNIFLRQANFSIRKNDILLIGVKTLQVIDDDEVVFVVVTRRRRIFISSDLFQSSQQLLDFEKAFGLGNVSEFCTEMDFDKGRSRILSPIEFRGKELFLPWYRSWRGVLIALGKVVFTRNWADGTFSRYAKQILENHNPV